MAALGGFSSFDFKDKRHEPPISQSWPGLFRWMKFLVKTYMSPSYTEDEDKRRGLLEIVASALYFITQDDTTRSIVFATPGVVELATHLWLSDK
ncbi:hypothetical protein EVG20_g7446 [Dentipellis fragilis]|uniref:Uncharacterized protein n=1 Tax=Dentipellis fragilis TaxID=205917 RepID=A0A4Y9YFL5_9AGAM|nr:hypothetical protein EVG20_g7446 [Dentipellis fragilis]